MLINDDHLALISANQPANKLKHSLMRAAVAIILRDGEHGTEFLMMQRAFHDQDPWSGQMSFPGGKIEPDDVDAKAAAMREAFEEVSADLSEQDYIGQLDDLYGLKVDGVFSVHVSAFVFKPSRELQLLGNEEVADMLWLPFSYLDDVDNTHDYSHPRDPNAKMPAVLINADKNQVLWGLSLRMLSMLHELLNLPMSAISNQEHEVLKEIEKRDISAKDLDDVTSKVVNRGAR
jgi:8-oxo-dGTP pyrophosphatase MutT (NUDIX family)